MKSFEAAARTGSYVAAAAELNVTPAAVSQQVRHLEAHLGRKLFTRFNNRIALTDAGQAIFAGVTPALEDIADLTARVVSGVSRAKLVISVLPSLVDCWFVPDFAALAATGEAMRIDLRVEDDPVDFSAAAIDIRICYGTNLYPEFRTVPLFRDEVVPMCSPAFRGRHGTDLASLPDESFIHTSWGPGFASLPGWRDWMARYVPGRALNEAKGHRLGMSKLALDFAARGLGVALGQRRLADDYIARGDLVELIPQSLPLGHDYCAVHPHAKARKTGVELLINWLTRTPAPHP